MSLDNSLRSITKPPISEEINFDNDNTHFLLVIKEILKCFKIYDEFSNIQTIFLLNYLNKVNYQTIDLNKIIQIPKNETINNRIKALNSEKKMLFNNISTLGTKLNNASLFTEPKNDVSNTYNLMKYHFTKELFQALSIIFEKRQIIYG